MLEHRRQLALLLQGAGRDTAAARVLAELAGDLERLRDPDDRMLRAVRGTLERLGG